MYLPCLLCFNVPFNRFGWYISCGRRKITASPQTWHFGKLRELFPQLMRSCSFHSLCNHMWTDSRWHINKKGGNGLYRTQGQWYHIRFEGRFDVQAPWNGLLRHLSGRSSSDSADKTPNHNWPLKQLSLFVYIPCVCYNIECPQEQALF